MNILVVDRSGAIKESLENELLEKGHDLIITDVNDFSVPLNQERIDLLLLDWQEGESKSIVDSIRQYGKNRGRYIPVIAVLKEDIPNAGVYSLASGVDDFICIGHELETIQERLDFAMSVANIRAVGPDSEKECEVIRRLLYEHIVMRRLVTILKSIGGRLETGVPIDILSWVLTASISINNDVHHRKEEAYFTSIVNRIVEDGENWMDNLNDVSFLKIHDEHVNLEALLEDLQKGVKDYLDKKENSIAVLKNIIDTYATITLNHIVREEISLFPISEKFLTTKDRDDLLVEFDVIENNIGADRIENRIIQIMEFSHLLNKN